MSGTTRTALSNGYLWTWRGHDDLAEEPSRCWLSDLLVNERLAMGILLRNWDNAVVRPFSGGVLMSNVRISWAGARRVRAGADPVLIALGKADGELWARPLSARELTER